ncbi:MAG: hypothetical protein ACPGO5_00940 [Patescibacteria group bacterium]
MVEHKIRSFISLVLILGVGLFLWWYFGVPEKEDIQPVHTEEQAMTGVQYEYAFDFDSDGDGIFDGEEVQGWGTDPHNPDSDGDLLNDYDEIKVYKTNPLMKDTDGDGFDDRTELGNGYDPLVK